MTTIDELAARVAALEAGAGAAPDNLQPNVLTVNPDGTIGANFTGHVHAQGLDLDAATSFTPPSTDRIRWLRTDGAVVADLQTWESAGTDQIAATAYDTATPGSTALAQVGARTVASIPEVFALTQLSGQGASRTTIIDAQGRSKFLQRAGTGPSLASAGTLTWPGGSADSTLLNVAMASTFVRGIACPAGLVSNAPFFDVGIIDFVGPSAGGVTIQASTRSGVDPGAGATMNIAYIIWGN